MRFKNLDLNLLAALDLLLTECNVSRAAERMHITQSAMSNALSRLRAYFEDDLLVLVGRRLQPTPRALALRDPVRDILVRIETSIGTSPQFDPADTGRVFRILVSDYTLWTLVPDFLAAMTHRGYAVRFDFHPQTDQPRRKLERDEVDLLIIPQDYVSDDHPTEMLLEDDFVCIADRRHARVKGTLDLKTFLDELHVVTKPQIVTPSFETKALEEQGLVRRVEITTFSFASLPLLVVGSDRLATIHRRLARRIARDLPLQILELPFEMPVLRQAMQWHSYRSSDPGLVWLRQELLAASGGVAG